MSAHDLRALMHARANELLNGNPNAEVPTAGINQRLLGDGALPKDWGDYMRMVGFRRGVTDSLLMLEESYAQLHDVPPDQK